MTALINHTEVDVKELIERISSLIVKAPRRENLEDIQELYDSADELKSDLEIIYEHVCDLVTELDQLNDHYQTWEDEDNDREARMDARESIEGASTEIGAILDQITPSVEGITE